MLKLPVKPPIVNENIDLSEYAKKSDVDAIGTSLGNKAEKKEVEKINSQLDTLTKKVDDEIKEIQSTTDTFKENINTSFNEFSNEQQNNFEALREEVLSDIEASYVGYDNEQHHSLESRLYSDFDKINQRFNNNSYLEYEGTSIKADNTYYGLTKDTVIKGRTLQNLVKTNAPRDIRIEKDNMIGCTSREVSIFNNSIIKASSKYTIIFNVNELTCDFRIAIRERTDHAGRQYITIAKAGESGVVRKTITVGNFIINDFFLFIEEGDFQSGKVASISDVILLEGDYSNTPIEELPFIEGIQSVGENEVQEDGKYLISGKSYGENIFNVNDYVKGGYYYLGKFNAHASGWYTPKLKKVDSNTYYYFLDEENQPTIVSYVDFYDSNQNFISSQTDKSQILTPSNCEFVRFTIWDTKFKDNLYIGTKQQYEPCQESTYSYLLNEPLRQLPNGVADSIDLETGVLTRRVGKIILNGTETGYDDYTVDGSQNTETTLIFRYEYYKHCSSWGDTKNAIVDTMPIVGNLLYGLPNCGYASDRNSLIFRIEKSKLETQDVHGFKKWLQANPTTIYYELRNPTTEQLKPRQLFSYEGVTHIVSNNTLQARTSVKIRSYIQAVVTNLINENETLRSNVDILNVENEGLKETNEVQDELIDINMMATDEVYTMIEPLLASQPMSMERGMSKLVDMYVAMVQRGLKTIDQVPIRYRAEVQAILEALEK